MPMQLLICLIGTRRTKQDCGLRKKVAILLRPDSDSHIHGSKANQIKKAGPKMTNPFLLLTRKWFEFTAS